MRIITKIKCKQIIAASKRQNKKWKNEIVIGKLHLMYRTSDAGYPKDKPGYIGNINCLRNALLRFPTKDVDWHIMCDNCSEKTMTEIYNLTDRFGVNRNQIYIEHIGHGAGTFRKMYEKALKFEPNDVVYFLENDYIHRKGSYEALINAFKIGDFVDYVTLYDHPDKYEKDYIFNSLLKSRIFYDGHDFWRTTPNTTMTLAAKVSTLIADKNKFWKWTNTKHPYDYLIFIDLLNRTMISPIPGYSTHGETRWLSPKIDWEKEASLEE